MDGTQAESLNGRLRAGLTAVANYFSCKEKGLNWTCNVEGVINLGGTLLNADPGTRASSV